MIDIYGIGTIIATIVAVIFVLKGEEKKALVAVVILLAIMLLKFILV